MTCQAHERVARVAWHFSPRIHLSEKLTVLEEINGDLLEADFWPLLGSMSFGLVFLGFRS
jgi:hypothetical protein